MTLDLSHARVIKTVRGWFLMAISEPCEKPGIRRIKLVLRALPLCYSDQGHHWDSNPEHRT